MRQNIGQYQKLEAPADPLQYQFLDADSAPLDVTGYTAAAFLYRDPAGGEASAAATISNGALGVVSVAWTTAQTASTGVWRGIFWLDAALASDTLVWTVVDGPGPTVPAP
jgi:hypothetical protein